MAKGRNMREVADEYRNTVVGLCCICQKPCRGFYGGWPEGGTCSGVCEKVKASQPKYPGHSEEEFLKRQGETFGGEEYDVPGDTEQGS